MQAIGGFLTTCGVLHTFIGLLDSRVLVWEINVKITANVCRYLVVYLSVGAISNYNCVRRMCNAFQVGLKKSKSLGLLVSVIRSIRFQTTVPKLRNRFHFISFVAEMTQQSSQYLKVYNVEL